MNSREIINVPIANLHDHHLQQDYFSPPDDAEIQRMAADIDDRGLQHPIEVVPRNDIPDHYVIVAGHKRRLALQRLRRETVPAVVREDFLDQGEEAVERHLISDNLERHNLSPLERARCVLRLVEVRANCSFDNLPNGRRGEYLEAVAEQLGCSRKSVTRWLNIAHYGTESLQLAYDRGELSVDQASRVAALPDEAREEVERAIRAGAAPRTVAARALSSEVAPTSTPTQRYRSFLRTVGPKLDFLLNHLDEVHVDGGASDRQRNVLNKMRRLATEMLRRET
ncbi:MAG: ParB N-terminal domain-containing protein [Planctomycetales bacterium]